MNVTDLAELIPTAPGWLLEWDLCIRGFPVLIDLRGCVQEPAYHGEGDVETHTRMVCKSLIESASWRMLDPNTRRTVFLAALLHDIGKPSKTRIENGRITSRGHSRKGEIAARIALWEAGVAISEREQVAALIKHHQAPFFLVDKPGSQRLLFEISQSARCDHLAAVSIADATGRVCSDKQRLLDNIGLFVEYAKDQGCLAEPKQFPSDQSRFEYFRATDRSPDYKAYDATRFEVVLMSGLPGAGKDTWIAENLAGWPVVSLDRVRERMKISAQEPQGRVVSAARELARQHLRRQEPFIWNATNLSRQIREAAIGLFADYGARIRIVYIESPADKLYKRNRDRRAVVPGSVISRLLNRWEVPDLTEAHRVDWVVMS